MMFMIRKDPPKTFRKVVEFVSRQINTIIKFLMKSVIKIVRSCGGKMLRAMYNWLTWANVSRSVMTTIVGLCIKVVLSHWFQNDYTRLQEYLITVQMDAKVDPIKVESDCKIIDGVEIPLPLPKSDASVVLPTPQPNEFYNIAQEEAASYREHGMRNDIDGPWGSDQWRVLRYLEDIDAQLIESPVHVSENDTPIVRLFKSVASRSFLRRMVRYLGGRSEKRHAREKLNKKLKISLDMRAYVFRKISRQCLRGADLRPDFSPENKELVERTLSQYVTKHFKHPGQEEGYVQLATALCFMDTSDDYLVSELHQHLIALRPGRLY